MLAKSDKDGCQILRYSPQPLSVPFHLEFSRRIMSACLPQEVSHDGADVEGIDWARQLLVAFWQQTRPQASQAQCA